MRNPLVSFCIITYNQEQYILETLKGAVSQDYDNMEIVISDDNSSDKTFEIATKFANSYDGHFKFILNKNEENLHIAGNVNKVIELSHGEYILLADGDDISLPERVKLSVNKIDDLGVLSMTFNMNIINAVSRPTGIFQVKGTDSIVYNIDNYLKRQYCSGGASRIIKRELIAKFGYLNNNCQTEDSVLNFRAFLTYGLGYCSIPTVNYRIHGSNISSAKNLLTKFDPNLIFEQNKHDLDIALESQYIDNKTYQIIYKYIVRYNNKEVAVRTLYKANTLMSRMSSYLMMLFSGKYSLKTKLSLFLIILRWKFQKK